MDVDVSVSSAASLAADAVQGRWEHSFDEGLNRILRGWAYCIAEPSRPVAITVRAGDEIVAHALACEGRSDLMVAGKGDGWCGFVVRIDSRRVAGRPLTVTAGNTPLRGPNSPAAPPARPPRWLGEVTRSEIADGRLLVEGWVADLAHASLRPEIRLHLRGCEGDDLRDFACRPEPLPALWGKGQGGRGFRFDLPAPEGLKAEDIRLLLPDGMVLNGIAGPVLRTRVSSPAWPRPGAAGTVGGLRGSAMLDRRMVRGWVEDTAAPGQPLRVRVSLDGAVAWEGMADRIETVGSAEDQPSGKRRALGYRVLLPPHVAGRLAGTVDAATVDGRPLPGFPLHWGAADALIGAITDVRLVGEHLRLGGWCVDSREPPRPVEMVARRHDGVLIARFTADAPLAADLRAQGENAPVGGFSVDLALSALRLPEGRPLDGRTLPIISPAGTLALLPLSREAAALAACLVPGNRQRFASRDARIQGAVDGLEGGVLRGWMRNPDEPDELCYADVFLDNAWYATVPASRTRGDLVRRFGDHGAYGFAVEMAAAQRWQVPGDITVQPRAGSWAEPKDRIAVLPDSKRNATISPLRPLEAFLQAMPPRSGSGRVSVIVLNRNGGALLARLFESFERHNSHADLEFIVVDHASTDDSAAVCARWAGRLNVSLIQRSGNFSFSQSNNLGAQHATGDILILANNDVRLCQDIVPQIVAALEDQGIGAVSPALLDDVPDPALESPGLPGPIQHLGVHLSIGAGKAPGVVPFETRASREWVGIEAAAIEVPAVTGAFLAVRRADFLSLGGLDEAYFYGHEDIDLSLRLRRAGKRIIALNQLRALHLRAYSRDTMSGDYAPVRLRNRQVFDERFGSWARRSMAADRFGRPGFWTGRRLRIAFVVTENDTETLAGDFFTARELAEALSAQFPVDCHFVPHRSPDLRDLRGIDVLISMRDDFDPRRVRESDPTMLRVAWVRNWAERFAARPWTRDFDLLWASSRHAADQLSRLLRRSVELVPIATAPARFAGGRVDPALQSDYCFTGSFWGVHREISQNLEPAALPYRFVVYGTGWEAVPQMAPFARGPLPYDRMPDVYASTRIVIDDANHATKLMQSVNSRVFDAIAAGCLVLTNGREGAQALFGDLLPTYDSPQELEALLRRFLDDEPLRRRTVAALQQVVAAEHTYAHRARQAWDSFARASAAVRIAIKIGAPNRDVIAEWGDYHFADSLRHALEPLGYRVRIDTLDEWANPQSNGDDVVLVLRGLSGYVPLPHQVSLCWVISHPDKISIAELKSYDHVFVASHALARDLGAELGEHVSVLLQCTDPARFHPEADEPVFREDILFVGNSRGEYRQVIRDALAVGLNPAIYGNGWRGLVPDGYVRAENVPNTRLAHEYRAARVVLNDHWDTMRRYGMISNRVFDVLACGGRLISDPVEGMEQLFGDFVRTYREPAELAALTAELQDEGPDRQAERDAFARRIMAEHGFPARAAQLDDMIRTLLARRVATAM